MRFQLGQDVIANGLKGRIVSKFPPHNEVYVELPSGKAVWMKADDPRLEPAPEPKGEPVDVEELEE